MTIAKLHTIRRLLLQLVAMIDAELRDRGVPITINSNDYPRC